MALALPIGRRALVLRVLFEQHRGVVKVLRVWMTWERSRLALRRHDYKSPLRVINRYTLPFDDLAGIGRPLDVATDCDLAPDAIKRARIEQRFAFLGLMAAAIARTAEQYDPLHPPHDAGVHLGDLLQETPSSPAAFRRPGA